MKNKCTIQFTGRAGLQFTDENGITYIADTEMLASKRYDIVIFKNDIKPIDTNQILSDKDKEIIISKIICLTSGIKWLVK